MRAIPTRYGGTMFRSRLEARWACMFDQLGWRSLYEPEDWLRYIWPRPAPRAVEPQPGRMPLVRLLRVDHRVDVEAMWREAGDTVRWTP